MLSVLRSGALRTVVAGQGTFRLLTASPACRTYAAAVTAAVDQKGAVSAGTKSKYTKEEYVQQWDYVNSIYFGPERDMKNFPNPTQPDRGPPVRLGVIPASWFDFFYPKTGVTGPYIFGGGLLLFLLSKEFIVFEHETAEVVPFILSIWFINYKFGDRIRTYLDKIGEEDEQNMYYRPLNRMKQLVQADIEESEKVIASTETVKHLSAAMKEGVELQLEVAYRQRLQAAYQEVKKRLDYESERENLKRKFEQNHMVNWIVNNVTKGITPQQEKESIQNCIKTLKNLAAKQAAV